MVRSFGAGASATHLLRAKRQRDTGTPTSLPAWKPVFQFPAQPANKLEAPQVHFQSQEEEQTALLRSDIAKPSSDSFSISEAMAHSRLCYSLSPPPPTIPKDPAEPVQAVGNLPLCFEAPSRASASLCERQCGEQAAGWHTGHLLQELLDDGEGGCVCASAGLHTVGYPASAQWQQEAGKEQPKGLSPRIAWFPPSGKQLLD